jgi:glycosyltransferase involved in cell wall biosynthesis
LKPSELSDVCPRKRAEKADKLSGIDWEIIIVDDASPDGTQEIAKQLAGVYGDDRVVSRLLYANLVT